MVGRSGACAGATGEAASGEEVVGVVASQLDEATGVAAMTCQHCVGQAPSGDARTGCGWCWSVSFTTSELEAVRDGLQLFGIAARRVEGRVAGLDTADAVYDRVVVPAESALRKIVDALSCSVGPFSDEIDDDE